MIALPRDPPRRADAERNRDRILQAARDVFAADGLEVSMTAVARAAGVGKATALRHFTSRDDLINAVFADHMARCLELVAETLADPDAWSAFIRCVNGICAMQAADRGFATVLSSTFPAAEALEARRAEAHRGFAEIIARAQATGHLREDVTPQDLVLLTMANAGVITAAPDASDAGWRRLVGQVLRGFATAGAPVPPLPPTPMDVCPAAQASAAGPSPFDVSRG